MTHSLRILLLRRLNQSFWLLLLMGLTTWGAWRFCELLPQAIGRSLQPDQQEVQQLHTQALASLDSSVMVLRMAVLDQQPEAVLLALNEQIRQQVQEVSLISSASHLNTHPSLEPSPLLDQCLTLRHLLTHKAPTPELSRHLALLQSQVRHLQFRASTASAD